MWYRKLVLLGAAAPLLISGGPSEGVAGAGDPVWSEVEITSPDARNRHTIEYIPSIQSVMVFGGEDGSGFPGSLLNDTWLWDGEDWIEQSPETSPGPRYKHAMAHDEGRNQMVLFGGITGPGSESSETWEWNPSTGNWSFKTASGPSPRRGHAMAYHPEADYPGAIGPGLVVLFGGRAVGESEAFDDMWVFDGKEWIEVTGSGPPGRYLHQMVYDEDREVLVLFGGTEIGASEPFGDTWEWDGESWELVSTTGPSARFRHSMAYDTERQVTILYGGQPSTDDTWEWDGNTWQESTVAAPDTPLLDGMAYDRERGRAVLFGGRTAAVRAETWEYDGNQWEIVASAPPPPRGRPAMAYDAARGNVLLFGGNDGDQRLRDTWIWDGRFWRQRFSPEVPPARDNAAVAYNEETETVMIFGGEDADGELGDTWAWDGEQWNELTPTTAPPARAGARMAPNAQGSNGLGSDPEIVLFGGWDGDQQTDQTWTWSRGNWSERATPGPPGRNTHAMAYHAATNRVVLFGGFLGGINFASDTHEWDGTSWSFAASGEPAARADHDMVYDSLREEIVLFGGVTLVGMTGQRLNDWWKWDGEEWTEGGPGLRPSARGSHSMAYDPFHGQVVLFGGHDGELLNDTWLYGPQYEIPPGARAVGDFENTGCTDFQDFIFLLENWGEEIDGNVLGFDDFITLLENWGEGC